MNDSSFINFQLVAKTIDRITTTFSVRTDLDSSLVLTCGPMPVAKGAEIAMKLLEFVRDGYDSHLKRLAQYVGEIEYAQAPLSCSVEELQNIGFELSQKVGG